MRIIKCEAQNFQSYQRFEFIYNNLGLTLIAGATKAGKSTLLDAPCWVLTGTTSKESAADDVRSWFSDDLTVGKLQVELADGMLYITRIRGTRSSQNDLYYTRTEDGEPVRGKDATDTQKSIYSLTGVDADLYINGSYLHQFSKADQFFISKAKDRRETLERIANLDLPIKLSERASEARKDAKRLRDKASEDRAKADGKLETARHGVTRLDASMREWDDKHERDVALYAMKVNTYENEKHERVVKIAAQLAELDKMIVHPIEFDSQYNQIKQQLLQLEKVEVELKARRYDLTVCKTKISTLQMEYKKLNSVAGICPTCLGDADNEHKLERMADIESDMTALVLEQDELEPKVEELERAIGTKPKLQDGFQKVTRRQSENKALLDKAESLRASVEALRSESNPYIQTLERRKVEVNPLATHRDTQVSEVLKLQLELGAAMKAVEELDRKISSLTWLYDKSFELRGKLLEQSIRQLEEKTNEYLERFFDAELRVKFALSDSDKLEVIITNEGYECPYKQLSGGERCLLKLAFSINYMRAAEDKAGVKFNLLMLDEALNGLDPSLKIKAFSLLQQLENDYESILLIDHHEEFKSMFSNRFNVVKNGAYSQVHHEQEDT